MSVLSLIPNVDQSFTYNTNAYVVIYNILLAAGFGIARWFTAKMMTDRYNRTGTCLWQERVLQLEIPLLLMHCQCLHFCICTGNIS